MTDDRAWDVEPYRPGMKPRSSTCSAASSAASAASSTGGGSSLDNPYGGPFISLAWHRSERFLVGNQVLMPFPLSVAGRRLLAGQSLISSCITTFRRQGVFEHTALQAFETLRQAGGAAVVAFPNESRIRDSSAR
jgi:hypothetical protein